MVIERMDLGFYSSISLQFEAYLFDIADCDDPVLIHDAVETVLRMLPDAAVPRFSKSPVLRCFFSFKPCACDGGGGVKKGYFLFESTKARGTRSLTDSSPFFVFSTRLFRLAGGSSDFAFSTKPPRTSSIR